MRKKSLSHGISSVRLKPGTQLYVETGFCDEKRKIFKSCFVNHASWEYEMIEKTEGLLEPYRELLEFYHAAYIELGRKIRKYSKYEVAQWPTYQ